MEYGVSTATLPTSKKLPSGVGFGISGNSAYDGVFAAPVTLKSAALSSRVEDYSEIFGGSELSRGSSIPILEVPELNEINVSTEFRPSSSMFDYSEVFGGIRGSDIAYEELLSHPKRKTSLPKQGRTSAKRRSPSKAEDFPIHPVIFHKPSCQFDGPKMISVSCNTVDQGDKNGAPCTTNTSPLNAIPGYTYFVDEISSLKVNRADGYEHLAPNVAHCDDNAIEASTRADTISPADMKTQCPNSSLKVHESDSYMSDLNTRTLFNEHTIDNGTWQMKMCSPETLACDSDKHTGNLKRPDNRSEVLKSDAFESGDVTYSPPELADCMNSNLQAAAPVAALKKAIEEAQEKFKLAKESTQRRKEGFKDCVQLQFNNELRSAENVGNVANRIDITKEIKPQTICEKTRDSAQIIFVTQRQMATTGGVAADLINRKVTSATEEAVTETMKEPMTTQEESKLAEMELKEEEEEEEEEEDIFYEFSDTGRLDEPKSESEEFYEFSDLGSFEEAPLDSEQVAGMVIGPHAIDVCEENEERKHGNYFDRLVEGRKTVKLVDNDLRQDKIENDIDLGNGPCEHEDFRHQFGSVQVVQNYEGNVNILNSLDTKNGLEKKLDLLHECDTNESIVITEKNCVTHFQEEIYNSVKVSLAEQFERDLRILHELITDEKILAQEQTESMEKDACGLEELRGKIGNDILSEPQELHSNTGCQIETLDQIENGGETSILEENKEDQEYTCKEDNLVNSFENACEQQIVEETVDQICAVEENKKRYDTGGALDENKMVREDKKDENLLNAITSGMEENTREWKATSEWVAAGMNGTSIHKSNEDEYANVLEDVSTHMDNNDERLNVSELDEIEILTDKLESIIFSQKEETPIDMELSDGLGNVQQAMGESFQSNENFERSETEQRRDNLECKPEQLVAVEGSPRNYLPENLVDEVPAKMPEKDINMPAEQNEDECVDVTDTVCNLVEIEELSSDVEKFNKNVNEVDVSEPEDIGECHDVFSERLAGSKNHIEVEAEPPTSSDQELDTNELHEIKTSKNGEDIKETNQTTLRTLENKTDNTNDNLHKVELEKESVRKIEEAREREREREREKEKLVVERAIREARERAFADARERAERAAMERANIKTRHRMMTESQEKLGKNVSQANAKSFAEKAALEAKLKAEHAAVERATTEARARALERAMSEKALSEERNKDRSSSTFRYIRTFNCSTTYSSEDLGGYDGESTQRCKARSERHQRVMERAAKALAEKSMRDHLAQKEQEERNRLAEALDADIKRWSSGKEGNMRALLSTLHYILGPTSGWQPIPLTDIVTSTAVKKAYRKATLYVHPDKLQQRGATVQQKYTCEKVFDLLKEAWNRFNVEER